MPPREVLAVVPQIAGAMSDPPGSSREGSDPSSSSAAVQNLLPGANSTLTLPTEGVYVGEGTSPVPTKLAIKIWKGEYVDMGELLPEFWVDAREQSDVRREVRPRQGRKVTDIFTWLQCYSTYVAVRVPKAPLLAPEFMTYQATIMRASQDYAGLAWVRYDAAFRRQAALTGNTRWSVINTTIYTMCFTGIAVSTKRCELCLATSHTERECAQRGDPDPGMGDRLKAIESAVLAITKREEPPKPATAAPQKITELCRKFNGTGCTFPRCKYSHACSTCKGDHPASRCIIRGTHGPFKAASQGRPY